jgi:threonyl-tRNA synthetase
MTRLLASGRAVPPPHGYAEVASPLVNHRSLWERSGHWEHYREDMFVVDAGEAPEERGTLGLKPMNCPNAMVIFNHARRSYRELPMRLADCDVLHRNERSGVLHGLFRVRKFQQDDAHIFLADDQVEAELASLLGMVREFYGIFGFAFAFRLGTRPAAFLGEVAEWDHAVRRLRNVLDREVGAGGYGVAAADGAFYGPKIDILIKDGLGREWQMGTMQLDYQLPRRFACTYVDRDGQAKVPVVIHKAIYGSLERFIGILLEHAEARGGLPPWLAPVQARVLPVAERHEEAAHAAFRRLLRAGLRVEVAAGGRLGERIKRAAEDRVPFALILGDRELVGGVLQVRARDGRALGARRDDEILSLFPNPEADAL